MLLVATLKNRGWSGDLAKLFARAQKINPKIAFQCILPTFKNLTSNFVNPSAI